MNEPVTRCPMRHPKHDWQCGLWMGHDGEHNALIPSNMPWAGPNRETPDPLAPVAQFFVGAWFVKIKQLVSGPLMWEATHPRHSPRAHRMPAGMSVEQVKEEATRTLNDYDRNG